MAQVLFTHSYFLHLDPKEEKAMMPYPPLGTLYAASYLRLHGYSVALFDSMLAESAEIFSGALETHRPKIVVIYDDDFNYLTKMCLSRMRSAAFRLAELAKKAGAYVIAHGSDCTDHVEEYLAHHIDAILIGEGEVTLKELVDHVLKGDRSPETIAGLAYVHNEGVHRTGKRDVIQDLNSLPFPAWDLVNVEQYREAWVQKHGYYSVNMVTTRGCPFPCNWCAKPIYGRMYNTRSPKSVAQEMKFLKTTLHPDHVWFCDDIFGLKPGWIEEFCQEVHRADAVIPFKCLMRVDLILRGRFVSELRKAGCTTVWVGAESGSQRVLDAMEKGTTVQQIRDATDSLKKAGIRVGFFLQFGYPGEMREDIDLTLEMLRNCMPHEIGISVSYPLPGTKFYENVRRSMGNKHNWSDSRDLDLMFVGTFVPDFYRTLHKVTHKYFRLWQGVDLLREAAGHPFGVHKQGMRRIVAAAYHGITLPLYRLRLRSLARDTRLPRMEPAPTAAFSSES